MLKKILLSLIVCIIPLHTSFAQDELKGVTLRVVADPTLPPFSYLENSMTNVQGIEVDLIKELQKRLGFSLSDNKILAQNHKDKIKDLKEGKIDLAAGGISVTDNRAKLMHFSPVYYKDGMSILYSKKYADRPLNSFRDLKNKKVVVVSGTVATDLLSQYKNLNINVKEVECFNDAIFYVGYNEADAFVFDREILSHYANKLDCLDLVVGDITYAKDLSQFALATPLDSPYKEYIDKEMQNILNDGTFDKIMALHLHN